MGQPKKHKTHGRTGSRRSHHALKSFNLAVCANCGLPVRPHEVCSECGYYKGRQVMTPKVKKKKAKK